MSLSVIPIDQSEKWDRIVKSFRDHDVYHLSGYVKGFQLHGDGTPLLFCYDNGQVRGMNVMMKRDIEQDARFTDKIEKNHWFDFITPYGYGGWLIEGTGDTTPLFEAYGNWCTQHRIVSEFVRFHPMLNNAHPCQSQYDVIPLGHTVYMDLSSPETIWAGITSKNRNMIRKAQKAGIQIFNGRFPAAYESFQEIYWHTMLLDQADEYYYFKKEYFDSILYGLPGEGQLFWAQLEDKVIAASIMITTNGYMNYHLSGSRKEYRHLAPTNLLLYHAALWGYANGCRTLHLGGGVGSREDSLYKFKAGFNRYEPAQFYIGKKIHIQEQYDILTDLSGVSDTFFFPAYRAGGKE